MLFLWELVRTWIFCLLSDESTLIVALRCCAGCCIVEAVDGAADEVEAMRRTLPLVALRGLGSSKRKENVGRGQSLVAKKAIKLVESHVARHFNAHFAVDQLTQKFFAERYGPSHSGRKSVS